MRLAIIAGGWHFPEHFYRAFASMPLPLGWAMDLFCVTHRDPDLAIVREEKLAELAALPVDDYCGARDRELYEGYAGRRELRELGWRVDDVPNTIGDWGFFNQWLERFDFKSYDLLLNCHDDTFIRDSALLIDVLQGAAGLYGSDGFPPWDKHWLMLGNGRYPEAPAAYVRGSFEFWKPRMLELLGGRIPLGKISLTREGLTDSPVDPSALMAWNNTAEPVRNFLVVRRLTSRVLYLSPHYRISRYAIEGERGFISRRGGAPWSFEAGLKECGPLPPAQPHQHSPCGVLV